MISLISSQPSRFCTLSPFTPPTPALSSGVRLSTLNHSRCIFPHPLHVLRSARCLSKSSRWMRRSARWECLHFITGPESRSEVEEVDEEEEGEGE
ncbi:hypothetical protein BC938DRAFT_470581, partial [Jimgerdemannia flammicorona]